MMVLSIASIKKERETTKGSILSVVNKLNMFLFLWCKARAKRKRSREQVAGGRDLKDKTI